jgi:hypothetical protein
MSPGVLAPHQLLALIAVEQLVRLIVIIRLELPIAIALFLT